MSFGGSTGDIIVFAQQAWIIYKSCKGAPKDFQDISGEVSCLHIVLKETDELVAELGSELSAERRVHLEDLTAGCRSVLKDLEDLLQKFNSLGSHSKRTFDRLRWSQDRVSALRDRIVSHTVLLTAFNTNVQACSQSRLEHKLNEFISEYRSGLRESSVMSSFTTDCASSDERQIWRQFRRELKDIGIPALVLEEKKEFIVAWFQQAFESGDFEERSDRGNDSDAEVSGDRRYKGKEVVIEERYVNNNESPAKRANYLVPPSPTRPRGRKPILPDFPPPSYTDSTVSRPSKSPQISIHEVSSLETPVEDTRFSQPPLIKRSTSLTTRLTHSLLHSKDALLKAVTSGDIGKAKSLVEMGHDVNYLSRQSEMTPLFVAATQNNYKMVKWLLEAGADPSTPGIFGYRALHRAVVGEGDDVVETVRLLLDHGADPSLVTDEGQTTLHCAVNVRKPNISVLRMLLEYGTPIGAVATGSTGSGQMVVLVDHLSVVIQNESMTALHIAVVQNNLSTVRLLLENGADPGRAPAATSTTALHLAAEYGSLHMVQLLLKHTAGLELVDRGGRTALIIATMHGKVDVIQLLLQYGADATAKDKSGRTPLYWARKLPTAQSMALLLIERGITVRARGAS